MRTSEPDGLNGAAFTPDSDPRPAAEGVESAWRRLLADALQAVDQVGVRYCVLRLPGADAGRSLRREVDILVDSRHLLPFERAVHGLGFVPLAAWGHGGHRFYVAFEEAAGEWLKLDVVTSLRYGGRTRPLSSPALAASLGQRRMADGTWSPDVVNALLGLILHGVLDKRVFKEEHRAELLRLRAIIDANDVLRENAAGRFAEVLEPALSWPEASAAIAGGDWGRLLERRSRIAWTLFRQEPFHCAGRWLGGELTRLIRPLLIATRRRGFSVALLGPDGAGKTSLARALAEDAQIRARIAYMGSNPAASTVGLPTTRWIRPARRGPRSAETGRSGRLGGLRYGNRLVEQGYRSLVAWAWALRGRFVIYDRHPREHLIAEAAHSRGPRLRRWLLKVITVRPDLVLVLDAPPELLRSRKNEHTIEGLERQRERYRSLPLGDEDCLVLDASHTQDLTVRRAKSVIWTRYRRHVLRSIPPALSTGAP